MLIINLTIKTIIKIIIYMIPLMRDMVEKQPPRGVLRKRCSENMQQIYRRTLMPNCDFNKVVLQLY